MFAVEFSGFAETSPERLRLWLQDGNHERE